jgi:hypothetical protein
MKIIGKDRWFMTVIHKFIFDCISVCKFVGFFSSVAEDSILLGYGASSLGI